LSLFSVKACFYKKIEILWRCVIKRLQHGYVMPRARIGTPSKALALGPILPRVCQYGSLAYHGRVITYTYVCILTWLAGVCTKPCTVQACDNTRVRHKTCVTRDMTCWSLCVLLSDDNSVWNRPYVLTFCMKRKVILFCIEIHYHPDWRLSN